MPSLAITGSMGTGKSTVLKALSRRLQAVSFSADEENRRLLEEQDVQLAIQAALGPRCYHRDGSPDRHLLLDLVIGDPRARKTLEGILHPKIRSLWQPLAEQHRSPCPAFFVAEIPLLYENRLESFFDRTIMVGMTESVQVARLVKNRSLSSEQVRMLLSLQNPREPGIVAAEHLLWNDGSLAGLESQIETLAEVLLKSCL